MSKLFKRGLKRVRRVFSARKGKDFEKRMKHQLRIYDIEQEVQQEKDKLLQQAWW
jgi:hypothetical protein